MPDVGTKARFHEPLEDYPRVSADDLRRLGFFEDREKDYRSTYRVGETPFTFEYCAHTKNLSIQRAQEDAEDLDSYGIVIRELTYGRRAYFVDLASGVRFLHLYLVEGRLLSRHESGRTYGSSRGKRCQQRIATKRRVNRLLGNDAWGPAAGARRQQLIDALTVQSKIEDLPKEAQEVIALRQQRRPRRVTSVASEGSSFPAKDMRTSAAAAQQRAEKYISPSTVFSVLDYAVEQGQCTRQGDPLYRMLDCPLAFTDQHGRLDARELVQLWAGETRWCRALRYPGDGATSTLWFMHAAIYTPQGSRVWVQKRQGANIGHAVGPVQIIRLVQSPRAQGRWYLECPVLRKPCDILYLRGDRFASRKAQRLVHPSQRLPKAVERSEVA